MTKKTTPHLHNGASGAAITVHIVRPATKTAITKVDEGIVHIRLAGSDSNHDLLAYLSSVLKVPVKQIEIVGGEDGDDKLITILDIDSNTVQERILAAIG